MPCPLPQATHRLNKEKSAHPGKHCFSPTHSPFPQATHGLIQANAAHLGKRCCAPTLLLAATAAAAACWRLFDTQSQGPWPGHTGHPPAAARCALRRARPAAAQ
eukprot:1161978-Pelagomonas_calceolata.AAC.2